MNNYENELKELNLMLNAEDFKIEQFEKIFQIFLKDKMLEIRLVDFEGFSEERKSEFKNKKIREIENSSFEEAARLRDFEVKCEKHLKLKEELKIVKSEFYIENKTLFYLCLGNSKNDSQIKEFIHKEYIVQNTNV